MERLCATVNLDDANLLSDDSTWTVKDTRASQSDQMGRTENRFQTTIRQITDGLVCWKTKRERKRKMFVKTQIIFFSYSKRKRILYVYIIIIYYYLLFYRRYHWGPSSVTLDTSDDRVRRILPYNITHLYL